jgi:hypothetical protein
VIREYRPSLPASVETYASEQSVALASEPVAISVLADNSVPAATIEEAAPVVAKNDAVSAAPRESVDTTAALPVGPGELLAMIPWAAPQRVAPRPESEASTLGELPKIHFASAIKPAGEHHFDGSVDAVSVTVASSEPASDGADDLVLAQVSPVSPREVRRNRILSTLVVADASDADRSRMAQVREVVTSSLGNDQLYDSVRRLGMGGDRFTLKF